MDDDNFRAEVLSAYPQLDEIKTITLDMNNIELATEHIESITTILNSINTSYQLFSDNCVYVHNVAPVDCKENDNSISFYDNQSPDSDKEIECIRWEDMILKGVKN